MTTLRRRTRPDDPWGSRHSRRTAKCKARGYGAIQPVFQTGGWAQGNAAPFWSTLNKSSKSSQSIVAIQHIRDQEPAVATRQNPRQVLAWLSTDVGPILITIGASSTATVSRSHRPYLKPHSALTTLANISSALFAGDATVIFCLFLSSVLLAEGGRRV